MRAKFGRGPTVVSKKGSHKFISRYVWSDIKVQCHASKFISGNNTKVIASKPDNTCFI